MILETEEISALNSTEQLGKGINEYVSACSRFIADCDADLVKRHSGQMSSSAVHGFRAIPSLGVFAVLSFLCFLFVAEIVRRFKPEISYIYIYR